MKNKFIISIDIIMYFFVFYLNFITFQNVTIYNYIKYIIIILGAIYCILNIKKIMGFKKVQVLNILIFLLFMWSMVVSINATDLSARNSTLACFINYLCLIESVFIVELSFIKKKEKLLFKYLWKFFSFFIVIQIFEIFIALIKNDLYDLRWYLFGNKFNVASLFLKALIFKILYDNFENRFNNKNNIVLIISLIFVSKSVFCTTYLLVGIVLFALFITKIYKKNTIFNKFSLFFFIYLLSLTFIFWYPKLFDIKIINDLSIHFGENISDLSGRITVYNMLPKICSGRLIEGYGFGTSYDVLMLYSWTADAQNGFWELVVNIGLVGSIIFSIILFLPFLDRYKSNKNNILYIYLIINVFIGFIEIPYNNSLLLVAIIATLINKFNLEKN